MKRIVQGDTLSLADGDGTVAAQVYEKLEENGICVVSLSGSINNEGAYDVGDELMALASAGKGIVLDMSGLTYLSNALAELLVRMQIRMEQTEYETMLIRNMPAEIYQMLKKQGCITSLDYELKEG